MNPDEIKYEYTFDAKASKITPPKINYRGRLLAFDQSLSSTGYALITGDDDGAFIWETGVLKSSHDLRGHEKTLQRSVELVHDLDELLDRLGTVQDIVYETPPVGGRMIRPESSLLAAMAVLVCTDGYKPHMISKQKAAKRWTGKGNATKKEVRDALMSFGYTPKEWGLAWNEHVSDSLSIGLLFMENPNG